MESIIAQLETTTLTGGYTELVDQLKRLDPPILNPTKSFLKRLVALQNARKCLCCNAVYDTEVELVKHMKVDKHKISQKAIAGKKRAFLHRIRETHPTETAWFELQEKMTVGLLISSEKKAHASLFVNTQEQGESNIVSYLSPAELATLHLIIYDEIFLINLRPKRKSRSKKQAKAKQSSTQASS